MSVNNSVESKVPVADAIKRTIDSALFGMELKGQIFKDAKDGSATVSIPGGRNFGGLFHAKMETADVNGRQIAISGTSNPEGDKVLSTFESAIKDSYLKFLQAPDKNMIQDITFNGRVSTSIRWAKEKGSNPKAPIAAYFLSL